MLHAYILNDGLGHENLISSHQASWHPQREFTAGAEALGYVYANQNIDELRRDGSTRFL